MCSILWRDQTSVTVQFESISWEGIRLVLDDSDYQYKNLLDPESFLKVLKKGLPFVNKKEYKPALRMDRSVFFVEFFLGLILQCLYLLSDAPFHLDVHFDPEL